MPQPTSAHYAIRDAHRQSTRLETVVVIYATLGVIGSIALFADEQPALGFVALLTTALTAGCAGALVQVVRLLAVMIERDLPAADYPQRATGKFAAVLSGQGVVVLLSIAAAGVLVAIVVAAVAS